MRISHTLHFFIKFYLLYKIDLDIVGIYNKFYLYTNLNHLYNYFSVAGISEKYGWLIAFLAVILSEGLFCNIY